MKVKKIPERTCIVTHEKCPKKDLLRIVSCPDFVVMFYLKFKINLILAYV